MMIKQIVYFVLLIVIHNIRITISVKSGPNYYRYLQQFGYAPKVEGRLFSVQGGSPFIEGIKTLQRLYKLPVTGELDEKTKKFMERPRCGNPDLGTIESIRRPINLDKPESAPLARGRSATGKEPEKYSSQSNSWPKKHLKWFIEALPKKQGNVKSREDIEKIMQQAFEDWEQHAGLKFEMAKTAKEADLKIKFASGEHGDGYPFDGQGATLAHAFYPTGGDIHFDDDEFFTNDYASKDDHYTLRLVAAHEIGHSLGLTHSYAEDSLMFPVYQQFTPDYMISKNDQEGIQKLYGKPEDKTVIETTTKTAPLPTNPTDLLPTNHWCAGKFDTGCEGPGGELYLFKDNQAWRYLGKTKRSWDPEPKLITEHFPSIRDPSITACVRSTTGYMYLFRNYHMWKLRTHWSVAGPLFLYGKNYPQNPHVALFHRNSVYLIRDHVIYRLNEFDHDRELEIQSIDAILNSPPKESIESGFTYDKRHYIFTKQHVYVYDSTRGNLLPGYPKAAANGWFACEKSSQAVGWNEKTTGGNRQSNERESHRHRHRHRRPHKPHHRHHHHHHRDEE